MPDDPKPSQTILEQQPVDGVCRIVLNRADARNAQDLDLLYALDDAFGRAVADEATRVIILAAEGPHFSAGHDLRRSLDTEDATRFRSHALGTGIGDGGGYDYMAREQEVYFGLCAKWRDLPKPTIAEVQGKCIAGGLMLAWVCDLIVASDDAVFIDNTVGMGVNGVEWFAHPWELGPRKAKELLFTGDAWTAQQALALGMVNHVVPREMLAEAALALASRIATKPAAALRAAKQSVNRALDHQGQRDAMAEAFQLHHLLHSRNMDRYGMLGDPTGMPALAGKKTSGDGDTQ